MAVLSEGFRVLLDHMVYELNAPNVVTDPRAQWVKWRSDFTLLALLLAEMERPVGEWAFEDVGVVGVEASLAHVGVMLDGCPQKRPSQDRGPLRHLVNVGVKKE